MRESSFTPVRLDREGDLAAIVFLRRSAHEFATFCVADTWSEEGVGSESDEVEAIVGNCAKSENLWGKFVVYKNLVLHLREMRKMTTLTLEKNALNV